MESEHNVGEGVLSAGVAELVLHLRQIQSAAAVSAAALRRQQSELDEDVANVLQRSVVDRIEDQIERLELFRMS